MLSRLSRWFLKISTGPLAMICLVVFLIFSSLILPDQNARAKAYAGDLGTPDTSLYYTAAELYRMAEGYGPQGRTAYIRARFTFDVVWPLVYLAFLVTALSWLINRAKLGKTSWVQLNLLPIASVIFDGLENGAAAIVMARYPQTTSVLDHLAGVFTLLKWLLTSACALAIVYLAFLILARYFKSSKQQA
ncbi:MAG: hypothetical protein GX142_04305 [Chloroflexi bacterium]|nr:hypothetical protein [Chloroflexota bacterium]